jgi:RNA polymerase sigma factor (sigma-70 family)
MTGTPLAKVVQGLRRSALKQAAVRTSDADLLRDFLRGRDEAAFEALVRRHGPMVLAVCRRVLRDPHDAEDAFQATFLVLVRRAGLIRPHGMVGNWLHGVAQRTALQARRNIARRREKERAALPRTDPEPTDATELATMLDQELACLPDKLRVAVVMCDLEGKTRREVSRELGLSEGTVASRLARGRVALAKRLTRRGIALAAGSLAMAASRQALAGVPASLVNKTVQAALGKAAVSETVTRLMEGVLRAMLLNKLKNVLGIVVAVGLALGGLGRLPGTGNVSGQTAPGTSKSDGKPAPEPSRNTLKIPVELESVDAANRTLTATEPASTAVAGEILVDVGGKTLKLKIDNIVIDRKRARYVDLPIAKDAKITEDGKELKLADLKAGRAELELAAGPRGLQVVGIRRLADKK